MLDSIIMIIGGLFVVFWAAQLVFFRIHQSWSRRTVVSDSLDELVSVSFIHPIRGLDFKMEENLRHSLEQDYRGKVEHIFSLQEEDDPAIPVIRKVMQDHPHVNHQLIVNPLMQGVNGKTSNMAHGVRVSRHEICVFIDSDLKPRKDFLTRMTRPLRKPEIGMTTCGQTNMGGKDFWTRFFAFIQNNETDFIWAFLTGLGVNIGATGAAFAMRREVILKVGGLEAFGDTVLEDFFLGLHLGKAGYKLALGPFIDCELDRLGKEKTVNYCKRIGVGLTSGMAYEIPVFFTFLIWYWIVLFIALLTGSMPLLIFAGTAFLLRMVQGLAMKYMAEGKILAMDVVSGWLFDLMGVYYLCYGFRKPSITWRGITYRITRRGRIDKMEAVKKKV
ncbi:MAG: glycosyltransferase [Clostridia bacterium]